MRSDRGSEAGAARLDVVPLVLLGIAFLYAAVELDRGWIPHDDGMLGQAAIRVLTGELPHRDFHEMYTGGLSYWHALSFMFLGIHLLAPRIFLLVAYAGFLAVAFAVARRFAAPRPASAAVLLAGAWSVPNYPAAMPSWYNLFFAVGAVWCVFRYLETHRRSWLAAAGAACGLSMVVKIVGIYTLGALLVALILVEVDADEADAGRHAERRPDAYSLTLAAGLAVFVSLVLWLVRVRTDPASIVEFVVPSAGLAALVGWRVVPSGRGQARARCTRLWSLVAPVVAGAVAPIALFLIPFVVTGSVGDFIRGTFVLPPQRLAYAAGPPLPLTLFAPTLVPLALFGLAAGAPPKAGRIALTMLAAALVATLALGGTDRVFRGVWGGLLVFPVIVSLATLGAAARGWHRRDGGQRPLLATITAGVLATFILVQFPFAGPVYFFYLAPLVVLCALAGYSLSPSRLRAPAMLLYGFLFLFAVVWVRTAALFPTAQGRYEPRQAMVRFDLERGGIRVLPSERAEYEQLVAMLQEHSMGTGVTYVTPDAPEAYFLSGLRNPTPVFFDFFDDPVDRTERTLATLEREDVRVIALNRSPQVSGPPARDLIAALESRYPRAANVGRFIVRWR